MDDELLAIRTRRLEELKQKAASPAPVAGRAKPFELDSASLPAFLENHPIAIIDVWASWCGPCRTMEPVMEELAHELAGRATIGKVNADENYDVVQAFGVQGIPSFLVFKDGKFAGKLVGARPKRDFLEVVRQLENPVSAGSDPSVQ
ncbi:MAG: thioredoxin family protein [Euryarchaeota archaeon]|nr:thioredoxin family protein [Euryarchaeota archaeon]